MLFVIISWISFRLDVLGGMLVSFLGAYFVYRNDNSKARDTGFSLNMAGDLLPFYCS